MSHHQASNLLWNVNRRDGERIPNSEMWYSSAATIAVLMDIRSELKSLNEVLHCTNFLAILSKLDAIRRNTTKKRRKKP